MSLIWYRPLPMPIAFDEPPLNEVSLGRTFLPRPDFLVPHYGAFWEQIRADFPKVDHAAPIVMPGEGGEFIDQGQFWLPRVWFVSSDSTRLLQLQQNRFHYNWRQTPALTHYIRFPAIQEVAVRLWAEFNTFIEQQTGQPLVPLVNELTYTNLIVGEESESAFDIADRVLRDSVWSSHDRFLTQPSQLTHSYGFPIPGSIGELTVAVATGRRPDGRYGLKLDLSVRGKALKGIELGEWSQAAHDFLVAGFKDLTTPAMHVHWRLKEIENEQ